VVDLLDPAVMEMFPQLVVEEGEEYSFRFLINRSSYLTNRSFATTFDNRSQLVHRMLLPFEDRLTSAISHPQGLAPCPPSQRPARKSFVLWYPNSPGVESVHVTGSWDNWRVTILMTKNYARNRWEVDFLDPDGRPVKFGIAVVDGTKYQFRFQINRQDWHHNPDLPSCRGIHGIPSNELTFKFVDYCPPLP
jgi:hypothetical protein